MILLPLSLSTLPEGIPRLKLPLIIELLRLQISDLVFMLHPARLVTIKHSSLLKVYNVRDEKKPPVANRLPQQKQKPIPTRQLQLVLVLLPRLGWLRDGLYVVGAELTVAGGVDGLLLGEARGELLQLE